MIVVCAWCHRVLGRKPPLALIEVTHGICPPCQDAVLRDTARRNARSIIVVPGDDHALYRHLVGAFATVPDVLVLLDRRRADRRRATVDVAMDRRSGDRRARALRPVMRSVGVLVG